LTFLARLENIKLWRSNGQRAPNKPLLLLLMLGRIQRGGARLVLFDEIETALVLLLKRFGRPRQTVHAEYPFARLCADGVWEVPGIEAVRKTAKGDVQKVSLREHEAKGGFKEDDYRWLVEKPSRIPEAADLLLTWHFPESLHDDIRTAVGLRKETVVRDAQTRVRDPRFRDEVLRNYEYRCAVCSFDIRIGDELLGLEAAHIMWHAAGGPDKVENGLALCGLHHKALDRGAWGMKDIEAGFEIMVSSHVHGQSRGLQWLRDFHGQPLRKPLLPDLIPNSEFVRWHAEEVFRRPPLP